jgi:hypothetical protein
MDKNDDASQTIKVSKNPTQESTPESTPEKVKDPEEVQDVIKKIEADGERMLAELKIIGNVNEDSLTNIMKNGEKEFIKKTGRRMTYGEMRQAYG